MKQLIDKVLLSKFLRKPRQLPAATRGNKFAMLPTPWAYLSCGNCTLLALDQA